MGLSLRRLLLASVLILLADGAGAQPDVVPIPVPNDRGSDAHLRAILKEGLDEALKEQVKHLFQTWLSAGGQASRTKIGMQRAIDAYRRGIVALDQADLRAQLEETFKVQSSSSRPAKLKPKVNGRDANTR